MAIDPLLGGRLELFYGDHAFNTPRWRWDSRINAWPGHLLWLVLGGRGTIAMRGQATYEVGAGDCFLFDMRRTHHGSNDPQQPLEIIALGFVARDGLGRERRPLWPGMLRHRRMVGWVALGAAMERVLRDHRAQRPADAAQGLRWILQTVWEADSQPQCTGPERALRERLAALADDLAAHPEPRRHVAELAQRMGLGREHFTRVFTRHLGLSPGRFLVQVRIDRAKALLRGTTATIGAIGDRLGYPDAAAFTRQFTTVAGCPPRAYRAGLGAWDTGNVVG